MASEQRTELNEYCAGYVSFQLRIQKKDGMSIK